MKIKRAKHLKQAVRADQDALYREMNECNHGYAISESEIVGDLNN